ncbi:MAG TPA: bacillithiol biosynthesis deacetylase BshB1 [Gaiellaceae bacterium]
MTVSSPAPEGPARAPEPAISSGQASRHDAIDVVAFSPHPDDVEFFCAGALLLAADAGLSTAVVDLTEGELSTSGDPERRSSERAVATELLGLKARISLRLPDGSLGTDAGHRAVVVQALRELRPTVVLAPYWEDRHPDHAAAGGILREACFLSGVEKYGTGPAHRPLRVYWYMLHHVFEPSVVIDVGPVWERRSRFLEIYASQVSPGDEESPSAINDGRFAAMLAARATCFGAMVGVDYGEPFYVHGPILLRSLPDLGERAAGRAPRYQAYL